MLPERTDSRDAATPLVGGPEFRQGRGLIGDDVVVGGGSRAGLRRWDYGANWTGERCAIRVNIVDCLNDYRLT